MKRFVVAGLFLSLMLVFPMSLSLSAGKEARASGPPEDPEKAIQFWDAVIRIDPNDTQAFLQRGKLYKRLGKYRRAIEDYGFVIYIAPENAESFETWGSHKRPWMISTRPFAWILHSRMLTSIVVWETSVWADMMRLAKILRRLVK